MAFKTTLFVCGLVLSIQNAYSQIVGYNGLGYNNGLGFNNGLGLNNGLGFNNVIAPSYGAVGFGEVDVSAIDIDSRGFGSAYGYGGLGNVGAIGLGSAGVGLGNVGAVGLGAAGVGLGNVGAFGLGGAGVGLGNVAIGNNAFLNLNALSAGGYLPISSLGPVVPAGLTVFSDNIIEGVVGIEGQLPFLSAVAFEGALPSGGSGFTQCGCGSAGNIGIISETVGPAANLGGIGLGNLGGIGLGNFGGRGLIL